MKNILKVFGLLFLTGMLALSGCSKDDDPKAPEQTPSEEDDNTASMALIFGDEPATFGYYQAVFDDDDNPYFFSFAATGMDANNRLTLPQIQIKLDYDTTAEVGNRFNIPVFYYSDNAEHYNQMKPNPEWVAKEIRTFAFTKFETSPIMLSFEAEATMWSNYEYTVEHRPEEELTTKELVMSAKNINFVNGSLRDSN
ncbi:MAG: hypothetical protein IJ764_07725 [Bacteroidales bacterium]|nr:hypothetical protein [Bacteroidales bacterium]